MWLALAATVSHFSMIGYPLPVADEAAMGSAVIGYARECDPISLSANYSLCRIDDKSGAELWIGLKQEGDAPQEVFTLNPALRGEGKTDIVIDADISPAEWKATEIRVQAHFAEDETPLILDLADPREAGQFSKSARISADITAFADELSFHDSEDAYYASQKDIKMKFAANHFIPSGMFAKGSEASNEPTAQAMFAGKILKMQLRRNATGKSSYWWFLVATYNTAVINVVADPSVVKGAPKVGGLLDGSFWLSARIRKN